MKHTVFKTLLGLGFALLAFKGECKERRLGLVTQQVNSILQDLEPETAESYGCKKLNKTLSGLSGKEIKAVWGSCEVWAPCKAVIDRRDLCE